MPNEQGFMLEVRVYDVYILVATMFCQQGPRSAQAHHLDQIFPQIKTKRIICGIVQHDYIWYSEV